MSRNDRLSFDVDVVPCNSCILCIPANESVVVELGTVGAAMGCTGGSVHAPPRLNKKPVSLYKKVSGRSTGTHDGFCELPLALADPGVCGVWRTGVMTGPIIGREGLGVACVT